MKNENEESLNKRLSDKNAKKFNKQKQKELKRQKKKDKKNNPYRIHKVRLFFKLVFSMILAIVLAVGIYISIVFATTPNITQSQLESYNESTMYANDKTTVIWSSGTRTHVDIKDVPESYVNLLLSTEDKEFYENAGFNPKGLINAGISYVLEKLGKGEARGGSGIDQQLIKLSAFSTDSSDRTISRKLKEIFLSSQLNKNYTKDEILEYYVNKIYLGEGAYGIQTISNVYFGKNISELTLSQQAIIAGLGQAPSAYNLYDDPSLVEERRNQVLLATLNNDKITQEEYDNAINTSIQDGLVERYSQVNEVDAMTSQHNAFVTSALNQLTELGYDLDKTPLQIYTTLDINAENQVIDILNNRTDLFQDDEQQAAVTVTDPTTGSVIAEVGGRHSTTISGLNRATQTTRSTGSSIKPILDYGPALEYFNWPTNKILDGSAYTYLGTDIAATDYGGYVHGDSEMKIALRKSYNTPAIRVLNEVGDSRAREFIAKLGIQSDQNLSESTALGLNASTTQMASAMGAFGQSGVYHPTKYINSIVFSDDSEKAIEFESVQAMRASTAYVMTSMLKGVVSSEGTMSKATIDGVTQAAKSGTVGYDQSLGFPYTAASDLWSVGYTKSLSIAVWQGYDSPNEPGHYLSQEFANRTSGLIYKTILETLSQGKDNSDWEKPATVDKIGTGDGLAADYVATDSPLSKVEKTITQPELSTSEDYTHYVKLNDEDTSYDTVVPSTPQVPSDYVSGQWETELQAEKDKFNSDHANDKTEAKNVE